MSCALKKSEKNYATEILKKNYEENSKTYLFDLKNNRS